MYKRKKLNLSVKRDFQIWLLIRVFSVVLFSSLIASLVLYFYSRGEITDNFYNAHIALRRVSDLLLPVVIAGSLVSLLAGMALSLFLPQLIAGAIYRIEEDLQQVKEGNLAFEITLRNNDILQDLAGDINDTVARLRNEIRELKLNHGRIETLADENKIDELVQALTEQREQLERLKT
ncbi:MAG: methyl-accepting chemotaxis protein [Desulfobulbaceae bacterium]|nr:methyl-accepting chemotaxis protein [Desulfobulbaceae bacterium]